MMKNSGIDFAVKQASDPNYDPLYHAPAMIIISAEGGNDKQGFNMANVACAAENMLLMATDMEIGSRYVMSPAMAFSSPAVSKQANFPEGYVPLCLVLVGYTDENIMCERKKENNNISFIV